MVQYVWGQQVGRIQEFRANCKYDDSAQKHLDVQGLGLAKGHSAKIQTWRDDQ